MTVEEIEPHGFCGGVKRAIEMARAVLAERNFPDGARVCCLHELVHNETVVDELRNGGMMFARTVEEVPEGAVLLISAHGASPADYSAAKRKGVRIVDATCPFVAAAHEKIRENFRAGMRTVVEGDPSHAEVRGYLGEDGACLPGDVKRGEVVSRVVQTTLDAGEHEGVCTATRDRQRAVLAFVEGRRNAGMKVGVLVVGGAGSANTRRLAEIAERAGARAWRVASAAEVDRAAFGGLDVLGVTSGASTPDGLFKEVVSCVAERSSVVEFTPMKKEKK